MPTPTRRHFLQSTAALASATLLPTLARAQTEPAKKIGYALVGLGRLNLNEVLPAFADCKISKPVALVSGDPAKAAKVAAQYQIPPTAIYDYKTYDRLKDNSDVDAVYIALPNSMHAEYTIRGAHAGKHILCEKPMASTDEESEQMIDACKKADRKLMIAYRLRYEPNTIAAIDLCRGGQVGKPKIIQAIHSFNIAPNQWRLDKKLAGGGPLVDLGIYCLNAARYLTGEEPTEITASMTQPKDDPRFKEVEESLVFTLRFPSGCLANCSTSYAHAYNARTTVFLEKATLDIDSAFAYRGVSLRTKPEMTHPPLPQINQFAAELDHFSDCILSNKPPRTPGEEGLQDMKHIQAIYRAAEAAK